MQDAFVSPEPVGPILGPYTTDQVVPFHDSTKVLETPVDMLKYPPTATQLDELVQDPLVSPSVAFSLGTEMIDQADPFQDSMRI